MNMLTLTFLKNHPLITPVPVPVLFKSHVLATSQKTPCFVVSRVVTSSRNTWRSFEFWRRVLTIWATFKFTQCSITAQSAFQSPDWPRQQWNRQHHRAADMILELCTSMKGFYVKAGQFVALQAFVPSIIRDKLNILHDDMPHMPASTAHTIIETELHELGHESMNSVFEQPFDLTSKSVLGSASIAQVHLAALKQPQKHKYINVAVKIQHPDTERKMMSDLANFRFLAEILQRTELRFDLVRPVLELGTQICREFDFLNEASAMRRIQHNLNGLPGVHVPGVVDALSSKRLLVMELLDGIPLTKLKQVIGDRQDKRVIKYVGKKILNRLAQCYGKMILTDGYFHADCHPGNILITNDKIDIALLDFGQTKQLTEAQRIGFARLVNAMARKDSDRIATSMEGLGIIVEELTSPNTKKKQQQLTVHEKLAYTMFDTASVEGVSDNPFSENSVLREASVSTLPKDLMLLLRTTQILKGLCKATHNDDFSMIGAWSRIARHEVQRANRTKTKKSKKTSVISQ